MTLIKGFFIILCCSVAMINSIDPSKTYGTNECFLEWTSYYPTPVGFPSHVTYLSVGRPPAIFKTTVPENEELLLKKIAELDARLIALESILEKNQPAQSTN